MAKISYCGIPGQFSGLDRSRETTYRIGEETDTGNDDSADMVPTKRSTVDLGESETTTLVGVGHVSKVIAASVLVNRL
jgi:hypothetical protein